MWIANIKQKFFLNVNTGTMLIVGPTSVKFVRPDGEWQVVAQIKDREKEPEEIFYKLLSEFHVRGMLIMVFEGDIKKEGA